MYVKWSGNIGAYAKMYPTRLNEYESDKTTEFFRSVQGCCCAEGAARWQDGSQKSAKRQLHSKQVRTWKRQKIEGMAGVFSDKVKKAKNKDGEIKKLHAKIGQLAVKNDFLLQGLKRWARPLLGSQHPASIRGVMSRNYSSIKQWLESWSRMQVAHDQPVLDLLHASRLRSNDNLSDARNWTHIYEVSFLGNRQIVAYLSRSGLWAGRYRMRRLMCIMVVQAIYKGPNTGRKHL